MATTCGVGLSSAAPRPCRRHSNPHSACRGIEPSRSSDPDLDLLTFAVFEGAFVCICAAYLFGGLAKDRIAARYRRDSLTDPLTGAANRRGFFETGERLLMRAAFARQPTAVIMFDLDRFKSINDRYGHHIGDEVITVFCRLARSHCDQTIFLAASAVRNSRAYCRLRSARCPLAGRAGAGSV